MTSCQKFCKKCNTITERYAVGTCKICVRAKNNAWAVRNREARNAKCREWNAKNAESKRATNARYREKNQKLINERRRAKRALDPNIERIKTAKRRINGYYICKDIVDRLLAFQEGKCACCGELLNGAYHLDHKIPISRGGTNEEHNLHLMLPKCNLQKYNLTFEEFLQKRRNNVLRV